MVIQQGELPPDTSSKAKIFGVAFDEGMAAHEAGLSLNDNPFDGTNIALSGWAAGWVSANNREAAGYKRRRCPMLNFSLTMIGRMGKTDTVSKAEALIFGGCFVVFCFSAVLIGDALGDRTAPEYLWVVGLGTAVLTAVVGVLR